MLLLVRKKPAAVVPPIACAYTLDNATGPMFGQSAWPTFDAGQQSAAFACDAGTTATYNAIPTVTAGPTLSGVVPLTGSRVYYFELGVTLPATAATPGTLHVQALLLNADTFGTSAVRMSAANASGKELTFEEGAPEAKESLASDALVDYRVGVYVASATGKVGVVGGADYGYSIAAPLAGASGFVIGLGGQQATPDETGTCGVRLYTSAADFTRAPPAGAYDICGNLI